MRYIGLYALLALAAPVQASTYSGGTGQPNLAPIDLLYPEIQVTEDGWRGLLPVILLDTEDLAEAPIPKLSPDPEADQNR